MHATPREWAAFGQFLLQDGVWRGARILPEGWVDYMRAPTPQSTRGGFGANLWLEVPQALPLGLLTLLFSIVPLIGTALVWVPVAAGLAMTGRMGAEMKRLGLAEPLAGAPQHARP